MVCFYLYFYDGDGNKIDREEVFRDRDSNRIHDPDDCRFYNMDIIKRDLITSGRSDDDDDYLYSLENIMDALRRVATEYRETDTIEKIDEFDQAFKEIYQVSQLVSVARQYNLLHATNNKEIKYMAFGYD